MSPEFHLDNPSGHGSFRERVPSVACFKGFESQAWRFRFSFSFLLRAELSLLQCNVLGLLQNSWITGGLRILYFTRANQAEESVDRESIRSRRREALTDS